MKRRVVLTTVLLGLLWSVSTRLFADPSNASESILWVSALDGPTDDTEPSRNALSPAPPSSYVELMPSAKVTPVTYESKPTTEAAAIAAVGFFELDRVAAWDSFLGDQQQLAQTLPPTGLNSALAAVSPRPTTRGEAKVHPVLAPNSPKMTVPAPGAVLLGALGVVLVGRLRRRRLG